MKVLICVSERGFWVEELFMPIKHLEEAGVEYDLLTPSGKVPYEDPASLDFNYVDPPLGREVPSKEFLNYYKEKYNNKKPDWKTFFKDALSLEELFPLRPYLSSDNYLNSLESYYTKRQEAWKIINNYDALLLVGGSGPVVDMVNNPRLHDLILGFYYSEKLIAAECYTVTCLAFARELDERTSILEGRHVTGHTMEYDYTDGWGLSYEYDESGNDHKYLIFGAPPYPLEYILRDTVGESGQFHGNVGRVTSVILDFPFLSSRSVASSDLCGKIMVQSLKEGVKRFGW